MNLNMCAKARFILLLSVRARCICAFRSLPEAEKRPAGTFSHVSADASGPREGLRLADRFLIADELWFMPSGQGTRRGGAFGLRWSLPGAVRIGHYSVPKGEAFVSIDFDEVPPAFQADRSNKFRLLSSR